MAKHLQQEELRARFKRSGRAAVPGPASERLLKAQRDSESTAISYPHRIPIGVRRAAGPFIEDVDGNVHIDFLTGAGVLVLGHNHPEVLEAAREQMGVFCHGLDLPTDIKQQFARMQLDELPFGLSAKMRLHFCGPTGGDAVDAAIKLAKLWTGGDEVLSFTGGYHGCGHGGLSFSSGRWMKEGIGNRVPGVHFFPFSDCSGCLLGMRRDSCEVNCASYFERALEDPLSGLGRPAAVLMELVQGEGGVVVAEREFVQRVRRITRRLGIPLIVDEVQTGCGRTGTWFAFEQYGIEPDIVVLSKGLSGIGAPVSLMLYRRDFDAWEPGKHIGTFRGFQVAFAGGVKTLEIFRRDGVLQNVRDRGRDARRVLEEVQAASRIVGGVRGLGLMLGVEIVDPERRLPSPAMAQRVQAEALGRGLIVELGGRSDTIVRLLPPLNIDAQTLDLGVEILGEAVLAVDRTWQQHVTVPGAPLAPVGLSEA